MITSKFKLKKLVLIKKVLSTSELLCVNFSKLKNLCFGVEFQFSCSKLGFSPRQVRFFMENHGTYV